MIQIYDSITQKKKPLKTIKPNVVSLYVCGVTVYDDCHIGHGRTFVAFDVVVRYLRFIGFDVNYIRNITDIDDKIINKANKNQQPFYEVVQHYIKRMHEDYDKLGMLRPDFEPRATETILEMIQMIEKLITDGFAYATANGDVYFRVNKFKEYGKLSKQSIEHLKEGVRVDIDEKKEDALDFALWKSSKPGEPFWQSPWGDGRPGWHIECSAMSKKCLGKTIDIHGGGSDLKFPHHENEIAQSEAVNGCVFANTWMHAGMLNVNEEKMSKSLNNFFTIADVLKSYSAEVLRYFFLSSHYRSIASYSDEALENAKHALTRFYTALRDLDLSDYKKLNDKTYLEELIVFENKFKKAMNDDFNTPEALSVLFSIAKEINSLKQNGETKKAQSYGYLLLKFASVLGILQQTPEAFFKSSCDHSFAEKIEDLILRRNMARKDKNWAEADKIRQEISNLNIILEDTPNGTTWRQE